MVKLMSRRSPRMASIELQDPDQPPPIFRHPGGVVSGSYMSVARDEVECPPMDQLMATTCLERTLQVLLANKLNLVLASSALVLLTGLSTLSIVATLAHGGGMAPLTQIICAGSAGDNDTSCDITAHFLPPPSMLPPVDPDDLDAVALHELTRRELFRVVKRAVRDALLRPGNDTSFFQMLASELTAQIETTQHPESGK